MLVWKLWTVYTHMFAVTAILSCINKICGLLKSTKWRHFENVKFEALSAWRGMEAIVIPCSLNRIRIFSPNEVSLSNTLAIVSLKLVI